VRSDNASGTATRGLKLAAEQRRCHYSRCYIAVRDIEWSFRSHFFSRLLSILSSVAPKKLLHSERKRMRVNETTSCERNIRETRQRVRSLSLLFLLPLFSPLPHSRSFYRKTQWGATGYAADTLARRLIYEVPFYTLLRTCVGNACVPTAVALSPCATRYNNSITRWKNATRYNNVG